MKSENFISILLIVENESQYLRKYIADLSDYLDSRFSDYEIILIDQNSNDETEYTMDSLLKEFNSIRYIKLSRRVSPDVSVSAGIENAIGDFVINLDPNRDPVTLINDFVEKSKSGYDIVVGTSKNVNSSCYKIFRKLSNKLLQSIGYTLPENSTGLFCISRRAINAITESGRFYCKLYMRMANIGYPITDITYKIKDSYIDKKTLLGGIGETWHYLVFNSTKPLRWVSILGILGSLCTIIFSFYSIIVNLIHDTVAEGWTTTILFISCLFLMLFVMMSFFGEYLARLLDDRSEHKEYNVIFEKNSSVMLDENRENVLFDSLSEDSNLVQTRRDK